MCGESYFHKDWPSSLPEVELDPWEQEYLAELDDDLPDFGDPEEDEDEWDEGEWFGDGEDYWDDPLLSLEDAIMLMNEDELLEWLLMDDEGYLWEHRLGSCGESALLDLDDAA